MLRFQWTHRRAGAARATSPSTGSPSCSAPGSSWASSPRSSQAGGWVTIVVTGAVVGALLPHPAPLPGGPGRTSRPARRESWRPCPCAPPGPEKPLDPRAPTAVMLGRLLRRPRHPRAPHRAAPLPEPLQERHLRLGGRDRRGHHQGRGGGGPGPGADRGRPAAVRGPGAPARLRRRLPALDRRPRRSRRPSALASR